MGYLRAKYIADTYISDGSEKQININSHLRKQLESHIREGNITDSMFNHVQNELFDLLKDPHNRYINTDQFHKCVVKERGVPVIIRCRFKVQNSKPSTLRLVENEDIGTLKRNALITLFKKNILVPNIDQFLVTLPMSSDEIPTNTKLKELKADNKKYEFWLRHRIQTGDKVCIIHHKYS